jgi:hypothetical protein
MIDYSDAKSTNESTLRRLLEFALKHDTSGDRLRRDPPKTKIDVINQLVWLGVITERIRGMY